MDETVQKLIERVMQLETRIEALEIANNHKRTGVVMVGATKFNQRFVEKKLNELKAETQNG